MSDQTSVNLSSMNPRLQCIRNKLMKQLHNCKIRLHQSAAVQELKTRTSLGIWIPTVYENEMYPAITRSCRVLNLMFLQPLQKHWLVTMVPFRTYLNKMPLMCFKGDHSKGLRPGAGTAGFHTQIDCTPPQRHRQLAEVLGITYTVHFL